VSCRITLTRQGYYRWCPKTHLRAEPVARAASAGQSLTRWTGDSASDSSGPREGPAGVPVNRA